MQHVSIHRFCDVPNASKLLKNGLFNQSHRPEPTTAVGELGSVALARTAVRSGGADRDRTGDLLRAKQVLSQLSYTPKDEFRILEFGLSFSCRFPMTLALYPHSKTRNRVGGPKWS